MSRGVPERRRLLTAALHGAWQDEHERKAHVRLLIIEDEEPLAEAIARGLRKQGWATDVALDGIEGLEKALVNDYDVIILDRNLPGLHGDEVCRRLSQEGSRARVLMLTAARSSS